MEDYAELGKQDQMNPSKFKILYIFMFYMGECAHSRSASQSALELERTKQTFL